MDKIPADDVTAARAGNIDGIAISHDFHDGKQFVVFNQVVPSMPEFFPELPALVGREYAPPKPDFAGDFHIPPRAPAFPLALDGRPATDGDADVRQIMEKIVCNPVAAALPDEEGRTVHFDFADVMDMVAQKGIFFVHILCSQPVTGKDRGRAAKMFEEGSIALPAPNPPPDGTTNAGVYWTGD